MRPSRRRSPAALLLPILAIATACSHTAAELGPADATATRPANASASASSSDGSAAIDPAPRADPDIAAAIATVDAARIAAVEEALVACGTRNTCSDASGATPGIGAARDYLRARFAELPGLVVRLDPFTTTACGGGSVTRENVIAWLPGAGHPGRVIVVSGHYDSRTVGVVDGKSPAPGANDSGSQSALVLEVARALAGRSYDATLLFAAFAGEEQGLLGSAALAAGYRQHLPGATIEAVLNSDIVGGDATANDASGLARYRLYAAGAPREASAGAPDGVADGTSPARGVLRAVAAVNALYVPSLTMVPKLRQDRPGRGSDHIRFLDRAVPAVRFIDAAETLAHQHTPDDTLAFVTPSFTARVAALVAASAATLARAPAPPTPTGATFSAGTGTVTLSFTAPAAGTAVDHYLLVGRAASSVLPAAGARVAAPRTATQASASVAALGLPAGEPLFVSVVAVDAAGHESLPGYPEYRCDGAGCAIPPGALDVTAKK